MFRKYFLLFSCVFVIFVDKFDAKLIKIERQPQVVSASNVTGQKYRSKEPDKYKPTWESLDSRPLPQWYDDAKVGESYLEETSATAEIIIKFPGIFLHFGVYSSISFGSEWFWTNWKDQKIPSYVDFMNKTQKPSFTYQVK